MCECEGHRGILLVLLVVDETGEVTAMSRELAKYKLVALISRQWIDKLGKTDSYNTVEIKSMVEL